MSNDKVDQVTVLDYLAVHAQLPQTTAAQREQLAGRPCPEWKPFYDNDAAANARYRTELLQFDIDVQAKLRYMVAQSMFRARAEALQSPDVSETAPEAGKFDHKR